jgi:hypothetical protein
MKTLINHYILRRTTTSAHAYDTKKITDDNHFSPTCVLLQQLNLLRQLLVETSPH